jgi:hypothetical protein
MTTLVLKIGLKKFLTINFHQKMSLKNRHIDIIAPNFANFYRQIFKIFKKFFHGWYPEKNEIVEESYHTLILC